MKTSFPFFDHKFSFVALLANRIPFSSLPSSPVQSELEWQKNHFFYLWPNKGKSFLRGVCELFFGLPVIKLRIPSLHQWQINWKFDSVSVRKRMFLIFNPTLISSENFPIAMEFLLTGLLSNVSAELLTFFLTIATISDYKREKSFETFLPDSLIQIMATLWIQFPLRIFSGFLALWLTMKRVES